MKHTHSKNRRRHRRYAVSCHIVAPGSSRVRDISRGGAHVLTEAPLDVGTRWTFGLALTAEAAPVDVVARVVWSTPAAMGVSFELMPPQLLSFVESLEREATPIL